MQVGEGVPEGSLCVLSRRVTVPASQASPGPLWSPRRRLLSSPLTACRAGSCWSPGQGGPSRRRLPGLVVSVGGTVDDCGVPGTGFPVEGGLQGSWGWSCGSWARSRRCGAGGMFRWGGRSSVRCWRCWCWMLAGWFRSGSWLRRCGRGVRRRGRQRRCGRMCRGCARCWGRRSRWRRGAAVMPCLRTGQLRAPARSVHAAHW